MSGENYLRSAYAYLYIRDFERAAQAFARAIESEPDNPEYYFHASVTALRNECFDLALAWSQRAYELAPTNALYKEHREVVISGQLTRKGHAAWLEGNLTEAFECFGDALSHDPLNHDASVGYERLAAASHDRVLGTNGSDADSSVMS